jgi:hypothetical protein
MYNKNYVRNQQNKKRENKIEKIWQNIVYTNNP